MLIYQLINNGKKKESPEHNILGEISKKFFKSSSNRREPSLPQTTGRPAPYISLSSLSHIASTSFLASSWLMGRGFLAR